MVIALSTETAADFLCRMRREGVSERDHPAYLRWARFYLDFCQKYGHPPREEASVLPFLESLSY